MKQPKIYIAKSPETLGEKISVVPKKIRKLLNYIQKIPEQ